MIKAGLKKSFVIAILTCISAYFIEANNDLAELSMTIQSLTNRATDLGLLIKTPPYKTDSALSDDLNQLLGSLETKKIDSAKQGKSKAEQIIDSLLQLFIDEPFDIEKNIISFEYRGVNFNSSLEKFANELLLIAHLGDYISSKYAQNETTTIVSNTFNSPLLYLFLNSILAQADRKVKVIIIGGISETDFKMVKTNFKNTVIRAKDTSTIEYYANSIQFSGRKPKFPIDIYLLNPAVSIDHITNNLASCQKKIVDKLTSIRIFPKAFDNSFLKSSFVAVDQSIGLTERKKFWLQLIKRTERGQQALKDQSLEGFTCKSMQSRSKMIADLIFSTHNKSDAKLFLFSDNKVASADFTEQSLTDIVDLYGAVLRIKTNLDAKNPKSINSVLTNNIRFYKYDLKSKVFNKYKSINSIDISATNLSAKT